MKTPKLRTAVNLYQPLSTRLTILARLTSNHTVHNNTKTKPDRNLELRANVEYVKVLCGGQHLAYGAGAENLILGLNQVRTK